MSGDSTIVQIANSLEHMKLVFPKEVFTLRFTVILTPDEEGGYVAECPVIPGCISEGDTIEEALANIREAIEGCLETMLAQGWELPKETEVIVATVEVPMLTPVMPS